MANDNAVFKGNNDNNFEDYNLEQLDQLESTLQDEIDENLEDISLLEKERETIGNDDALQDIILNVVIEQFENQIAEKCGQDFIKENKGLNLDLRKSAHIQTTENFEKGKLATHNKQIDYQKRYDDWQNCFVKDDNGNIVTHKTRMNEKDATGNVIRDSNGNPVKKQVANVTDEAKTVYYNERKKRGLVGNAENRTDMDETVSVCEIIRDPAANAHMTLDERIEFDLSEKNLNEMDSSWNRSKSDTPTDEWLDNPNANGQKPNEIFDMSLDDEEALRQKNKEAREEYEKRKKEGEEKSIATGKKSRKEEAKKAGKQAITAAVMGLLAELVKELIQKFIIWLKSKSKTLKTLGEALKEAIHSFASNLKQHLKNAADVVISEIVTAIFGPIIGTLKKIWTLLKQGLSSLKEVICYLKDPANKEKSSGIVALKIGKIITAGLSAAGTLELSEAIEKGLMTFPVFAFEIPLIGSLANILGGILSGVIMGIVGALIIRFLQKKIDEKRKAEILAEKIDKQNEILTLEGNLSKARDEEVEDAETNLTNVVFRGHTELKNELQELSHKLDHIYDIDEDDQNVNKYEDLLNEIL